MAFCQRTPRQATICQKRQIAEMQISSQAKLGPMLRFLKVFLPKNSAKNGVFDSKQS
jgi:hypothetical protein